MSDSGTSDTTSAVPGNIIALRPGRANLFNPDVGAPTHPRHSAASEGGSLSQENLAMLTRMATTFKEREQAPVLGKDLSRFQTELDKIAADLGWTEEGLWND